jgi:hypothetical protein
MKRIDMVKYGFVRTPSSDFSDDGNRFLAYRAGRRVRVTKLVSDGYAYIDGTINEGFLNYSDYKNLPHYSAISNLNGVKVETLTEDAIQKLYEDCLSYEAEYIALENKIKAELPTEKEIRERCFEIMGLRHTELDMIDKRLAVLTPKLLVSCGDYEWKNIREHYQALVRKLMWYNVDTYPKSIVGKPASRNFMSVNFDELKPTFYYRELMKIFDKYENK